MRSRPNKFSSRWILAQKNGQSGSYKLCEMKSRQVRFFLYWPVENVQFCLISIGLFGWLSSILYFPKCRFHKNVNSPEVWKHISKSSSPKGSSWRNNIKSKFSDLSSDSPYFLFCACCTGLSSTVIKVVVCLQDIVTRFAHQSGYHVERRFGWDCHGLPVVWFNIVQECIYCFAKTLKEIIRNKIPERSQCFSNGKFWCCHSIFLKWMCQESICHMSVGKPSHVPKHSV